MQKQIKDVVHDTLIKMKYHPWLIGLKLISAAIILLIGTGAVFFMMLGITFGTFTFDSDTDYLLPLDEKELKARKLARVVVISIKYIVLFVLASVLAVISPKGVFLHSQLLAELFINHSSYMILFILAASLVTMEVGIGNVTGRGESLYGTVPKMIMKHKKPEAIDWLNYICGGAGIPMMIYALNLVVPNIVRINHYGSPVHILIMTFLIIDIVIKIVIDLKRFQLRDAMTASIENNMAAENEHPFNV